MQFHRQPLGGHLWLRLCDRQFPQAWKHPVLGVIVRHPSEPVFGAFVPGEPEPSGEFEAFAEAVEFLEDCWLEECPAAAS